MSDADVTLQVQVRLGSSAACLAGRLVDALRSHLASGYPSGVALAVIDRTGAALAAWGGQACIVGRHVPMRRDTLFDLASLTKVVAAVPLALTLERRGLWRLSDPVAAWVPEFPRSDTTLWHLLTHTSGLVPHRPFFATARGRQAIQHAVCLEARESGPGETVVYSDLNFMLLGWAIEQCAGMRLDRLFQRAVAEPLGMSRSGFRPAGRPSVRVAATELDGDQRTRPGLVWGSVHDGNAFALGGIAGHAGLFAPLDDLVSFVRPLLDPATHPVLSVASIAAMTRQQAGMQPDVRALGWGLAPVHWGAWPDTTYWHTGFTGTSLLVSPERGLGVALLMNGVHPTRRPDEQKVARADIHAIIAEACS